MAMTTAELNTYLNQQISASSTSNGLAGLSKPTVVTRTDEVVDWDEFFDEINEHEKASEDLRETLMQRFMNDGLTNQYNGMPMTAFNLGKMIVDVVCDYEAFKKQEQQKPKPRARNYCKVKD